MAGGPEQPRQEPLGDLIERLTADARTVATAELGVLRAIIAYRMSGLKIGLPLLIGALFIAQAVVTALLIGLLLVLSPLVGFGWATVIVVAAGLALVTLLGWAGLRRCASLTAPLPEDRR